MDSVAGKVTLYDIIGYWIPGMIFEIIFGIELFNQYIINSLDADLLKLLGEMKAYLGVIAVIVAYCIGLLISETANWIEKIVCRIFKDKLKGHTELSAQVIRKALEKSKVVDSNVLSQCEDINLQKVYFKEMYARIQGEQNSQRIHNYASAKVLYRNLVISILSALITTMIQRGKWQSFVVIHLGGYCVIAMVLLSIRWWRFYGKVQTYTTMWFVEKYDQ